MAQFESTHVLAAVSQQPKRLIVTADDFGWSEAVNRAVVRAHRAGILTTASLMVNEPGFTQAVEFARQNPLLGVGLHLTLVCGHSTLAHAQIPGIVNDRNEFGMNAFVTGLRYFFDRRLHAQLRAEIRAQLQKFKATGLDLDHVSGHLHMHMHPTVFGILIEIAQEFGISRVRLTRDRFWLSVRLARGRWLHNITMALVFAQLARYTQRRVARHRIKYARNVFGLLQDSQVDEAYILKLLARLPAGVSELYLHPSEDNASHELDALLSLKARAHVERLGIELIRYRDL